MRRFIPIGVVLGVIGVVAFVSGHTVQSASAKPTTTTSSTTTTTTPLPAVRNIYTRYTDGVIPANGDITLEASCDVNDKLSGGGFGTLDAINAAGAIPVFNGPAGVVGGVPSTLTWRFIGHNSFGVSFTVRVVAECAHIA